MNRAPSVSELRVLGRSGRIRRLVANLEFVMGLLAHHGEVP